MQELAKEIPLTELFIQCSWALLEASQLHLDDKSPDSVKASLCVLIRKIKVPIVQEPGVPLHRCARGLGASRVR